jgi:hypothetical protein
MSSECSTCGRGQKLVINPEVKKTLRKKKMKEKIKTDLREMGCEIVH